MTHNGAWTLSQNCFPALSSSSNSTRAKIDALTLKIAQTRSILEKMEAEREQLIAALDPTRNVPAEILSAIIQYAMPAPQSGYVNRMKSLFNFSLVCKAWRDASYPLWAYLKISLRKRIPSYQQMESWFAHAGATPRRLEIHQDTGAFECPCADGLSACRMASAEVVKALTDLPRLRHIGLSFTTSRCFRRLLVAIKVVAEKRQVSWTSILSLSLQFKWNGWAEKDERDQSVLNHIPSSVTSLGVEIEGPTPPFNIKGGKHPEFYIPSEIRENLSYLSLNCSWDSPVALNVLSKTSNLTKLRLHCWGQPQSWNARNRDVVLLHTVESLELILDNNRAAMKALPLLRFPNLKTLLVHMDQRTTADAVEEIFDALKFLSPEIPNPARGLRSLTIEDGFAPVRANIGSLMRTLRNLRTLEHLALYGLNFDAQSMLEYDGERVLPYLQHLELEHRPAGLNKTEVRFDTLLDYVKSRQENLVDQGGRDTLRNIGVALKLLTGDIPQDHIGGAKKMKEMFGVTLIYFQSDSPFL